MSRKRWYLSSFRAFDTSCFSAFEANAPAPPVHANTSGQKSGKIEMVELAEMR